MNDWKPYRFDEIVHCNPKISIKKGDFVENCEMEDINPSLKFLYPREGKIYKGSNSKFQNGDTVFARITPCLENGKIAQVKSLLNGKGIGSTEFFVFREKKDRTTNDFVYYLSKTNLVRDTAINSMTGASGRQRADIKAIKKLIINIPDIVVQEQIALTLCAYDDLIDLNNKRIKALEETAKNIFKEWFIRMRFPEHHKVKFVKGIPQGWQTKPVRDFGRVVTGKTPSTNIKQYHGGNVPFIKTPDMHDNLFIFETKDTITQKGVDSQKRQTIPPNSIIVNCIGELAGSVSITTQTCQTNQQINSVILTNSFEREFLLFSLCFLKEMILMYGNTGSTMTNLSKGKFENLKVLYPGDKLANQYHQIVFPVFEQVKILSEYNIHLRDIRDRLLPRIISGKLHIGQQELSRQTIQVDTVKVNKALKVVTTVDKTATKKTNPFFKRRVLAAYIIDHLKTEKTFGHVKLMKLMYLSEHLAEIETASNYHRDAAGPYDNKMIRSIDKQLREAEWFDSSKIEGKYVYQPMDKVGEYNDWFEKYYNDKKDGIDSLLQIFGKAKTEKVEMVATLYEAHRDLKSKYQIVSDNAVVNEVLNNWHDSKKRIEESRWLACLQWMKEKSWIT